MCRFSTAAERRTTDLSHVFCANFYPRGRKENNALTHGGPEQIHDDDDDDNSSFKNNRLNSLSQDDWLGSGSEQIESGHWREILYLFGVLDSSGCVPVYCGTR